MRQPQTYQVGILEHPKDSDPTFSDLSKAEDYAQEASIDDQIYGIWNITDDLGELLFIAYQQTVFQS